TTSATNGASSSTTDHIVAITLEYPAINIPDARCTASSGSLSSPVAVWQAESQVQSVVMQEEPALGRVLDVLMSMTCKVDPVVLFHRIQYNCHRRLIVDKLGVIDFTLYVRFKVYELFSGTRQWSVARCFRLSDRKHPGIAAH
ncbi:unnamed protein product, partial [Rhizoctonia solani]